MTPPLVDTCQPVKWFHDRYDLLLSLPFPQLADALAIEPKLTDQLVAYANTFTMQQRSVLPRETLEVLGLR